MSYINIETSVRTHRKFLIAGPAASWLWVCGNAFCQDGLTDGFIHEKAITFLGVPDPLPLAAALVTAGLWEVVEDGWHVHDYLDYHRDAETVRGLASARREWGKLGGRPKANLEGKPSDDAEGLPSDNDKANLPDLGSKPNSVQYSTSTVQGARVQHGNGNGTAPTTRHGHNPGLLRGPDPTHAFDGPRVYVPQKLHTKLLRLRNGNEVELLRWYEAVSEAWSHGAHATDEPGADMFGFWQARYAEQWPAAKAKATKAKPSWVVGQ